MQTFSKDKVEEEKQNPFYKEVAAKRSHMSKGEGKVALNKKAHHDYIIVRYARSRNGPTGTEIKSVRAARINLKDGFAQVKTAKFGWSIVH